MMLQLPPQLLAHGMLHFLATFQEGKVQKSAQWAKDLGDFINGAFGQNEGDCVLRVGEMVLKQK
jgi:hypothetical protein